jgi:hypothetical protein
MFRLRRLLVLVGTMFLLSPTAAPLGSDCAKYNAAGTLQGWGTRFSYSCWYNYTCYWTQCTGICGGPCPNCCTPDADPYVDSCYSHSTCCGCI